MGNLSGCTLLFLPMKGKGKTYWQSIWLRICYWIIDFCRSISTSLPHPTSPSTGLPLKKLIISELGNRKKKKVSRHVKSSPVKPQSKQVGSS